MSKKYEVVKQLKAESDRVKAVDLHPKEPLVICALFYGQVTLWNYETQTLLKSFEVASDKPPVRCVKFMPKTECFACGADDYHVRVYNYNTMEKKASFEAHLDYIRAIAVHDTLPLLLTSADDATVKMWDTNTWQLKGTFEGHTYYVMAIAFNPKDPNTFATGSLDTNIGVWNIHTPQRCNFSLEGHDEGVNAVEYYPGGDRPYIISGSDDGVVKVWDYQTKQCLQTLNAHTAEVNGVCFHPELPLVFTISSDANVCTYNSQTWRLENSTAYNMGRGWALSVKPKCNKVALGFDSGMVVLNVGQDDPVMSMDAKGTIFVAQTNDITRLDVKSALEKDVADGELIQLPSKDVGTCEGLPRKIVHGPNGQYVAVLMGDDDFIVNSSLGWRSKAFGRAIAFVFSAESGTFAVLENNFTLKTYKQFKVKDTLKLEGSADMLFGGPLLGVRIDGCVTFFDWDTLRVIRQITETPQEVVWSDSGELCALVTEASAFILKYDPEAIAEALASGVATDEDGFECAFDLVEEIDVKMRRALWIGDCLLYVNRQDRICYYIGGETTSLAVIPRGFSLLGYVPKENRVYCMDRDRQVVAYQLFTSVIEFKTAIVRGDMQQAQQLLPGIPDGMRQKVAEFLQTRQHLRLALNITPDVDHQFDLAMELGDLDIALSIVRSKPSAGKWKLVGDLALEHARFDIGEEALVKAQDHNGLLLLYSSRGDLRKIQQLGRTAQAAGRSNVAFTCFYTLNDHDACIDLLCLTNRFAEAAFFARTYRQTRICEVVDKWRKQVAGQPRLREAIADPKAYANLFPTVDLEAAAAAEAGGAEGADTANPDATLTVEHVEAANKKHMPPGAAPSDGLPSESVRSQHGSPDGAGSPTTGMAASDSTPMRYPSSLRPNDVPETPANSFAAPSPTQPRAPPPSAMKPEGPQSPSAASPAPLAAPPPSAVKAQQDASPSAASPAPPIAPPPSAVKPAAHQDPEEDLFGGDDGEDGGWGSGSGAAQQQPKDDVDDIFDNEE